MNGYFADFGYVKIKQTTKLPWEKPGVWAFFTLSKFKTYAFVKTNTNIYHYNNNISAKNF